MNNRSDLSITIEIGAAQFAEVVAASLQLDFGLREDLVEYFLTRCVQVGIDSGGERDYAFGR